MWTQGKSKVSGVNQGNEGGTLVEDFSCVTPGIHERGGVFSAPGVFVSD